AVASEVPDGKRTPRLRSRNTHRLGESAPAVAVPDPDFVEIPLNPTLFVRRDILRAVAVEIADPQRVQVRVSAMDECPAFYSALAIAVVHGKDVADGAVPVVLLCL